MTRQTKAEAATKKQTDFARCFLEGHSATEAYRRAYGADGMKDASIRVEASRLLRNPRVSGIIEQARTSAMRDMVFTLTDSMKRLETANQAALSAIESGDISPASVKLFTETLDKLQGVSNRIIQSESQRYILGNNQDVYFTFDPEIETVEVLPFASIVVGGGSVEE